MLASNFLDLRAGGRQRRSHVPVGSWEAGSSHAAPISSKALIGALMGAAWELYGRLATCKPPCCGGIYYIVYGILYIADSTWYMVYGI